MKKSYLGRNLEVSPACKFLCGLEVVVFRGYTRPRGMVESGTQTFHAVFRGKVVRSRNHLAPHKKRHIHPKAHVNALQSAQRGNFFSVTSAAFVKPVLAEIEARATRVMTDALDSLEARARFIAEGLYKHCVLPDGGERLNRTGTISPATSLKSTKARIAFQWATGAPGGKKIFSKAACRKAIRLLMKMDSVRVPQLPGLPYELWLETQVATVHHLCQRARINFSPSSRYRFPSSMDWEETQVEAGVCALRQESHIYNIIYIDPAHVERMFAHIILLIQTLSVLKNVCSNVIVLIVCQGVSRF